MGKSAITYQCRHPFTAYPDDQSGDDGMTGKDSTEVFGPLVPSDRIVIKASDEVKDGTVIN